MDNEDAERLGASIRARRRQLGLTIVQVAGQASLSHPFLSQVERGLARPSLDSLGRIALALGTSQIELMSGSTIDAGVPGVQVSRSDATTGTYGKEQARILVHGDTRFTPIDVRGTHQERGEYHIHGEDEFVTVLLGTVDVDLGDDGVFTLGVDESLYFPGGTRHRWGSHDGEPYRLLVVKERIAPRSSSQRSPLHPSPQRREKGHRT
ncbi:helix-turn-helix domain-containing protein [Myceligenerans indicum]|uniref:Helix-turn-helix transcriptional regulator n=1 Tax=Myceligenerans indicum TaxID=2593663 RepID=A0ABS1LP62_9MICO|nr:helix-turn-helix transcriptional regulator [Myceligenerans indicum]MBL0887963.1 helix-turn-helix transcriptional regulator [Myceligenerans indicum]